MTENLAGQRGFITVQGRRVHYRRWGKGPVVLALHGSPQSSRTLQPLALLLREAGFCVIAPDSPGNGLSAPLPTAEQSQVEDYAAALAAFADAIGLQRVAVYGFHTGAGIGAAFAALYPERVTALACDGLASWTEAERLEILRRYLPPFAPAWDGSHLAWLWARMEEQTVFFPWHEARAETRMDYDVSPPEAVHANVMDLLDAGDHYRPVYRSAFTFRPELWIPRINAPMMIGASADDVLREHLQRPPLRNVPSEVFTGAAAVRQGLAAFLMQHPADPAPVAPPSATNLLGLTQGFVECAKGVLAWTGKITGAGPARPLVLLHGAGDDATFFKAALPLLARQRPVVAMDLPGHGASNEGWNPADWSIEGIADEIAGACAMLGLRDYAVAGVHVGGQIAVAMARADHARAAAILGASIYSPNEAEEILTRGIPSLSPTWDGSHLLRAFRIAKWERLFFPWFRRERAHARMPLAELDEMSLHRRALSLLKAREHWQAAVTAELRFDLVDAIRSLDQVTAFAIEGDPLSVPERHAALGLKSLPLAADPALWSEPLGDFSR